VTVKSFRAAYKIRFLVFFMSFCFSERWRRNVGAAEEGLNVP